MFQKPSENLPNTSKKPPKNLQKASQNEVRNRPGDGTLKNSLFREIPCSILGSFLLFSRLGPTRKKDTFSDRLENHLLGILGPF